LEKLRAAMELTSTIVKEPVAISRKTVDDVSSNSTVDDYSLDLASIATAKEPFTDVLASEQHPVFNEILASTNAENFELVRSKFVTKISKSTIKTGMRSVMPVYQ